MSKINVCFMTEACLETLKVNHKKANSFINEHKNNDWLAEIYSGEPFETKKFKFESFELKTSDDGDYSKVDLENSIKLYEAFKDLPRYIVTDERFWMWVNMTFGYKAALQALDVRSDSTFHDHWLFGQGKRRGLFFGVLSRCYFRVALSCDDRLPDKYELTKFVIENPERFRNLTWRASSSEKHIVLGVLKAEKAIVEQFGDAVKNSLYKVLAKSISSYGSVRLIDIVSEEDIESFAYQKMLQLMNN